MPIVRRLRVKFEQQIQLADLDQKQQMFFCPMLTPVKDWKWCCNVVWHQSASHRLAWKHDQQPRSNKPPAPGQAQSDDGHGRSKVRRIRPPTITVIVSDDLREYAKRKRECEGTEGRIVDLGHTVHHSVKPQLLGPSLKRRFTGNQSL